MDERRKTTEVDDSLAVLHRGRDRSSHWWSEPVRPDVVASRWVQSREGGRGVHDDGRGSGAGAMDRKPSHATAVTLLMLAYAAIMVVVLFGATHRSYFG